MNFQVAHFPSPFTILLNKTLSQDFNDNLYIGYSIADIEMLGYEVRREGQSWECLNENCKELTSPLPFFPSFSIEGDGAHRSIQIPLPSSSLDGYDYGLMVVNISRDIFLDLDELQVFDDFI